MDLIILVFYGKNTGALHLCKQLIRILPSFGSLILIFQRLAGTPEQPLHHIPAVLLGLSAVESTLAAKHKSPMALVESRSCSAHTCTAPLGVWLNDAK